jgi:GMP synthase-like glutamine amidotransferase
MTIGLLLCDHLDPDVIELTGDYTELYPAAFDPVGVDLRIYDATVGELPGSVDECDGWIVSGSRRSAYEDEGWIHDVAEVIRTAAQQRRPQMGICFGHQLIAQSLGGSVQKATAGWGVGAKQFDVVAPAPWMEPTAEQFRILMSHQDQVVALPPGAELVATANYCPVGAYRIDEHVFCVQGHPEFVPLLSRTLIGKRRSVIGDDVADAGLASLDEPNDHPLVTRWIAEFFAR